MKKLILPIFVTFLFLVFLVVFNTSTLAFFHDKGSLGSSEFDCQKFWEGLSDDEGLTIGGPRQGSISNISDWKFSSKKKTMGKTSGDSCDIGGIRYDTDDSEGEAKTGFEINISYFPNQEEAMVKIGSLKAAEEVEVEDKNVSGDTYSMKTLKLMTLGYDETTVGKRENFLAPGNYGRTVGRVGSCVVSLTHTWYALAYQTTGDNNESQVARMDEVMGMTQEGWGVLSEAKDVQQFCGGKASDSSSDKLKSQQVKPQRPQSGQTQSNAQDNEKDKSQISQEQPKIGLPLFATGWLRLFETFWNAAGVNVSSIIKSMNMFGGTDHTLCDPANCEISLENLQRKTGLSEEEIINSPPSVRDREINPYKLQKQNGDVYVGDYDKAKGFIVVTGKDDVIFSTFIGLEDDIGGFEVSPNTKINFPPTPFQEAKKSSNQDPGQLPTSVEIEYGEAEFFIIGSAERSTIRPTFTVATPNTEVKVSGTHFWVKSNPNEKQTTVGVYEGEVEVTTKSGQKTTVTPNGDKPGVVVITQKLSTTKLALAGLVLITVIVGVAFFLKRRGNTTIKVKKRK